MIITFLRLQEFCIFEKNNTDMKTDIEISHQYRMLDIRDVAANAGIACDDLNLYGNYMAKVPAGHIDEDKVKDSHLILVTAITPTKAGVGKTTVSIGLSMGLNHIGKKRSLPYANLPWDPVSG